MIIHREIRYYPSLWKLDVFVLSYKDREKLSDIFHKKYGASKDYYLDEIDFKPCVITIDSTNWSELKGERRIVMILYNRNLSIIVHEIVHAVWHYSNGSKCAINHESQEWQALLTEYLFDEIRDFKEYKEL